MYAQQLKPWKGTSRTPVNHQASMKLFTFCPGASQTLQTFSEVLYQLQWGIAFLERNTRELLGSTHFLLLLFLTEAYNVTCSTYNAILYTPTGRVNWLKEGVCFHRIRRIQITKVAFFRDKLFTGTNDSKAHNILSPPKLGLFPTLFKDRILLQVYILKCNKKSKCPHDPHSKFQSASLQV